MDDTNYIIAANVTDTRITARPWKGQTVSGYGGSIPTRYMLKYSGRWYRVKVMQYGNAGSAYITVKGRDLFLDSETEYRLRSE